MPDIKDTAAQLQAIGNLVASLGLGNNAGEWNQNLLVSLLNRANQGDTYARQIFESVFAPARDYALNTGDQLQSTVNQGSSLYDQAGNLTQGIPQLLQQFLGGNLNPSAAGAAARSGNVGDTANAVFQGGGWTPQYEQLFSQLGSLMGGTANNTQLALGDVAPSLISQRGQTAYTQNIQDRAGEAANAGGRNDDLNYAMQQAVKTLGNQGYTPNTSAQADAGLDAFKASVNKALGNNLLSPETAANWGREEATNNQRAQAEAVYRQAQARGGGPGSLVASGTGQQMLADFADQTARAQTSSARQAFMDQESKLLQDKGIAASLAGAGSGLAQGAEQNAISRTGQAFSAIPGTQSAATQFMNALLGAGGDAGNQEVARMNAGTGMAGTLLGSQNQAAGTFNNAVGNQNQYALGAGNLANTASQTEAGIGSQNINDALRAFLAQTGASNQALGVQGNLWSNIANAYQRGIDPLTQMGGQALNYASTNTNLMGAPFGRLDGGNNPTGVGGSTNWGGIISGISGALGNIFGNKTGSGEGAQTGGTSTGTNNGDFGGETATPTFGGGGFGTNMSGTGYYNLFGNPQGDGFGSYGTPGFAGYDPWMNYDTSSPYYHPFWGQWN